MELVIWYSFCRVDSRVLRSSGVRLVVVGAIAEVIWPIDAQWDEE